MCVCGRAQVRSRAMGWGAGRTHLERCGIALARLPAYQSRSFHTLFFFLMLIISASTFASASLTAALAFLSARSAFESFDFAFGF